MATFFQGQVLPEKFDENIMTQANSLVANLNKMPALSKVVIDLHKQHTFTWLLEKASRFAKEEIKDHSYRFKQRTQFIKPTISHGGVYSAYTDDSTNTPVADVTALVVNDKIIVRVKHDHANKFYGTELNPNDMVKFRSGATAIVLDKPVASDLAKVNLYTMKIVGGTCAATDFAAGSIYGFIGSAFGEGSLGGYMNNAYSDWYINHTTISRKATKITGVAAANIEWISDGSKYALWYFEQEHINDTMFFRGKELSLRFARSSMDVTGANAPEIMGHSGVNQLTIDGFNEANGITAPQIGNGIFPQFEDANLKTYDVSAGLQKTQLQNFIALLAQKGLGGGTKKHEWLVITGMNGQIQFNNVMESLNISSTPGGSYTDFATGKDMAMGTNFTTYYYLGNKITVVYDEVADDPALNPEASNGLIGKADFYFLDFSEQQGQSNIELITTHKRSFIKKYLNGMHSFNGQTESYAISGYDGSGVEVLSESGGIVRVPQSCGIMEADDYTHASATWV